MGWILRLELPADPVAGQPVAGHPAEGDPLARDQIERDQLERYQLAGDQIERDQIEAKILRISSTLWDLGTTGIAECGARPGRDDDSISAGTTLLAGFATEAAAVAAAGTLGPDVVAMVEPVAAGDWVDSNKRGRLELADSSIDLAVGAAFGHGNHPTTRLALALAEPVTTAGVAMLDFGTGTGILAVAAAANGAASVTAVDNDPAALAVAEANLAANPGEASVTVSERLPRTDRRPRAGAAFDVIAANVLLPVHQSHGRALCDLLAPAGFLILSGILVEQRAAVLGAYPGLVLDDELVEITATERWVGLRLKWAAAGAHAVTTDPFH